MIIFDLDSTLIDARGIVQLMGDWQEYAQALEECPAYEPGVKLAHRLNDVGLPYAIASSRPESQALKVQRLVEMDLDLWPMEILLRPAFNLMPEPELFWSRTQHLEPSLIITGRDKTADYFREHGCQSLVLTMMA